MSLLNKLKSKVGSEASADELQQYADERVRANLNKPLEELTPSEIREIAEYRKQQENQQVLEKNRKALLAELQQEKKFYYQYWRDKLLTGDVSERFRQFIEYVSLYPKYLEKKYFDETLALLPLYGLRVNEDKKDVIFYESYAKEHTAGIRPFDRFETNAKMNRGRNDPLVKELLDEL